MMVLEGGELVLAALQLLTGLAAAISSTDGDWPAGISSADGSWSATISSADSEFCEATMIAILRSKKYFFLN